MLKLNRKSVLILISLSLILYVFFSTRSLLTGRDFSHAFLRTSPATITGIVVSLAGLYLLTLVKPDRRYLQVLVLIAVIVPGSILSSAIGNYLVYAIDSLFDGRCRSIYCAHSQTPSMVMEAVVGNLFVWSSLFMIVLWVHSTDEARRAERRAADARDAARVAQLRALRYQVNPHFLFNSLNSLATLVDRGDGARASGMIREMGSFLRWGLASDPVADVELEDEVEMQRRYLEIERYRFSHRMIVEVDIADDVRHARVPALILQPLVENAIKHGVASTSAPVTVAIRAERAGEDRLSIRVEDDAPAGGGGSPGLGVGLRNVVERLSARFGDRAALDASPRAGGGYRARITLPLARA